MSRDVALLIHEVQRLSSEVEYLRSRVDAYERSRWMRLHPGLAIRQVLSRPKGASPSPERLPTGTTYDDLAARFRVEVFERGSFTHDWFTGSIPLWEPIFEELEGRSAALLEIGSFEGLAACYMLWRLRDAHLTCVDTFEGSVEHAVTGADISTLHQTFTENVALVDSKRVRMLADDSRRALLELLLSDERFDFVSVDGSHLALDVLVDAAYSWQLLAEGGVLVFDDYRWKGLGANALLRPGPAIDAFLELVSGKHELLWRDGTVGIRKTG